MKVQHDDKYTKVSVTQRYIDLLGLGLGFHHYCYISVHAHAVIEDIE